ncbi:hypothetical protein VKT23_013285 [Stygiomarasmius scandens]|uniref:F-box domain-containing protein n=1 Tax=Marasmiellus scandens TaxID=2682957 RepID=A0ABR1J4I1_9AGAR
MTIETLYPLNPNLLTTNAVPDENDIHRIRQICADHTQDLNRMNAQIQRLQESLEAITLKRDALLAKLSSLQSITSPLRTFPPEVLQSIFTHCLESFAILSAYEAPVLLTQICSKWRSIAIDTPALWASFHIALIGARDPFESYDSTCSAIRDGLQTFLSRSSSLPLNISLRSDYSPGLYNEDIIGEVNQTLEILLSHHKRWKYLSLQLPQPCMNSVERLRGEDLPNLETATVFCVGGGQSSALSSSPFFENAPRLQQLSVGARDPSMMLKLIGCASWARLTHLVVCFNYWETSITPPLGHIADALKVCVSLEECSITLPGSNLDTSPLTSVIITLPKLRKMAIVSYFPSQIVTFLLDSLVLPKLRELTVDGNLAQLPLNADSFWIHRGSGQWGAEHMINLLKSMPELESLDLSQFHVMTGALLEAFSAVSPDSEEVLCSKLTRIEFGDTPTLTEDTLVRFLSTRLSPPASSTIVPMEHVIIKDAKPSSESFLSRFGDAVQFSTPWSATGTRLDQHYTRPTSRVPVSVRMFGF